MVLKLALAVYTAAADDIIGNTAPMQQWVPHFVSEGVAQQPNGSFSGEERGFCGIPAGCRLGPGGSAAEADYQWQHYKFCAGHAPSNAKPLWTGAPPIYNGSAIMPLHTSDVPQVMIDRGVGGQVQEKDGYTPPEVFTAPVVGSAGENAPVGIGGVERPVPLPAFGGPRIVNRQNPEFQDPANRIAPASIEAARHPVVASAPAAVPQQPQPRGPSAAEVIQQSVAAAVGAAIPSIVGELKAHFAQVLTPPAPAKTPRAKREKASDAPPTMFEMSRKRAHELGMNTFGKGKEEMDKYIAEHTQQPVAAEEPAAAPA